MSQEQEWKPYPRAGYNPIYHLVGVALRLFFRLYARWKVVGLENVARTGGLLLAANHASYLDPPLLGAALYGYRRLWIMAKAELWQSRLMAFLCDRCMGFPIRRHSADRATLRRVLDWLAQGEAVAMFPEGERTRDGLLHPALPGIALLAQKSGVPVVPVAILGTYEMLPANRKSIRRVPITIAFGKPLRFGPDAAREEITTAVMDAIAALMTANGRPTSPPTPAVGSREPQAASTEGAAGQTVAGQDARIERNAAVQPTNRGSGRR
ncbi:MAG TPA: lysophospholipid acyltransferase family protein [Chthonomonadaceae bacterium]|nr:lysophospholipid acyltransferase family protein [Chthonomonadaceae bacterium]